MRDLRILNWSSLAVFAEVSLFKSDPLPGRGGKTSKQKPLGSYHDWKSPRNQEAHA